MIIEHNLLSLKTAAFQCGGRTRENFRTNLRARFLFTVTQYCFSHPILVDLVLSRRWMKFSKARLELIDPRLNAAPLMGPHLL
jgi:hypothetical protein